MSDIAKAEAQGQREKDYTPETNSKAARIAWTEEFLCDTMDLFPFSGIPQ